MEGWIVVVVAALALVGDGATAAPTRAASRTCADIRATLLHDLADAPGSADVIVAGAPIPPDDWRVAVPIVTLAIAGRILWRSAARTGSVIRVPMPGSPADLDAAEGPEGVPGVASAHHLHPWQVREGEPAVDAHVVVAKGHASREVRARLKRHLEGRPGVRRSAPGLEPAGARCRDARPVGH